MSFWNFQALGYDFLVYGVVFFMLFIIVYMLPKYNTTWSFAAHLSLLASFSILHGMAEFFEMQRLKNPIEWLTWSSCILMLTSYVPLLEFTRRTWNEIFRSFRLSEPWMFGTASLMLAGLALSSSASVDELLDVLRLFVVAFATLLSGIALFATVLTLTKRDRTGPKAGWLLILGLVFVCYGASSFMLFQPDLSPPTPFLAFSLFDPSVQSLRTVCAVLASLGLVSLVLLAGENCQIDAIAFEWSQKALVITDANNVILRINNAFTESTGFTPEDVVGRGIGLLKSGRHEDDFYQAIQESVDRSGNWQGEIWERRKNGEIYLSWLFVTAVKNFTGAVVYYVGMRIDITERKAMEEEIKRLAFYDPLTKLPNRLLLRDRLKHCIEVERRAGQNRLALLMLDLDRFKAVNDRLGHKAGDELLQQVAERITNRLRNVDMVARLGGDEFIVMLENIVNPQDASRVAEDIIRELSKPFTLSENHDVWIGASIGISLYQQHGDSLEILMDHADKALYQAKDQGRGCFAYFSEDLTIAARERIELEARLRRAIQQQELCVYYQPQVDIASGLIVGAEALVRWIDPNEGLIPPARFIPIAEETSLIEEIGEWVLRETCNQGQYWLVTGLPPITLAVNISPYQLKRCDINALAATVLAESGFPAQLLELEITESGIMENQDNVMELLDSLRSQGIRLAIDDFGTGYSSLAYLKSFPLNVLKIDKRFIDDIPYSKDGMEIAATIIAMGHTLGLKVLAEGVETPEQLAFLRERHCDTYQGYIKSRPLPAKEFANLMHSQLDDMVNKRHPLSSYQH
ncbi:putative bifunctional diguanylate cyclase/phosphodiesterase [Methylomicrobium lacus]|uniref:putative bifunctional diguanylate cyclase/phosphodiesterase n=1 Tax=Methylomicrobium lacus TaxID=136992 RepID=UPI0035A98046